MKKSCDFVGENLEGKKKCVHLHPQQQNTAVVKASKKFFKKTAARIWQIEKLDLPLQSVRLKKALKKAAVSTREKVARLEIKVL